MNKKAIFEEGMQRLDIVFEEAMQRLETIIHELERGDITLEQRMALFEEGTNLSASLSKQLDAAEQKVSVLMKDANGDFKEQPFEKEEA